MPSACIRAHTYAHEQAPHVVRDADGSELARWFVRGTQQVAKGRDEGADKLNTILVHMVTLRLKVGWSVLDWNPPLVTLRRNHKHRHCGTS